jgi:hypothetical protein
MIDVPFLTEAQIEAKADALLAAFSRDREPILGPPVPPEDKLLYYLGLRLHMDDLHARLVYRGLRDGPTSWRRFGSRTGKSGWTRASIQR